MKIRKRQTTQRDWTKTLPYSLLVLLATLTTTGVGVYVALWSPSSNAQKADLPPSYATPTPTQTPTPIPEPKAQPSPTIDETARRRICRKWISATTGKRYNFVCTGKDTFDVYQLNGRGPERIGSGTILDDGRVESELIMLPRIRTAPPRSTQWKLKLSVDARRLEGTHSGDDPRETFPLTFHRAP